MWWKLILVVAIASLTSVACTGSDQADTSQAPGEATVERGSELGQTQVAPGPGEVKLWVSNQSFADDPVEVTISIDGVALIDESFAVEGQHNSIAFDLRGLNSGEHVITAVSDTGVDHTAAFTVLADEPRWLVLDYWYYPEDEDGEGRHFSFAEFDHAVAFD